MERLILSKLFDWKNSPYRKLHIKLRVRFSLDNLKLDDDMLNIPFFMADHTDRLIGIALEQL